MILSAHIERIIRDAKAVKIEISDMQSDGHFGNNAALFVKATDVEIAVRELKELVKNLGEK